MDLEHELRQAMAEHVTKVSASRTLAHDARRRHQRTVRRRTGYAVAAAGVVAAIAVIPTYQAIHPQTVGARMPRDRQPGQGATNPGRPTPPDPGRTSGSAPGATAPRHSGVPSAHPSAHGPDANVPKALLRYLPSGVRPDKLCRAEHTEHRETTTCRWTGPGGWIEVRLVRGQGLNGPTDLGLTPPMPTHVTVHGHPALRGGGPTVPSQVMWVERDGLGVWVGVSPSLSGWLTRIADGVNVR